MYSNEQNSLFHCLRGLGLISFELKIQEHYFYFPDVLEFSLNAFTEFAEFAFYFRFSTHRLRALLHHQLLHAAHAQSQLQDLFVSLSYLLSSHVEVLPSFLDPLVYFIAPSRGVLSALLLLFPSFLWTHC